MKKFALLFCVALVACSSTPAQTESSSSATSSSSPAEMTILLLSPDGADGIPLFVEVASDPQTQQYGLMNREHLDPDAGMLFAFDEPRDLSFWMKNTLIPLDIIFFDENGWFISMETMEPCTDDPCPGYASAEPAQYALEVNAGYADDKGIGDGWRMEFTPE